MIAQIIHGLEYVVLVEVGMGLESDFDTGVAKDVAYSGYWGKDAKENRSTRAD